MSRRYPTLQRRLSHNESNPYQVTSLPLSHPHNNHHHQSKRYPRKVPPSHTYVDAGFSDATTTDAYYDYCDQNNGFHHSRLRESRNTFSDDSGSTRLPYLEFDEESNRLSRQSFSERSIERFPRHHNHQSDRRVYAQEEEVWEERLYHEIQTPCEPVTLPNSSPRRIPPSRLSDRPQSSMSSALTTAMIHGCGGKCQTFESVCYFVLQLIFTMGMLIGVSLCIAGIVLRKSAARNLQVLVYIGILLAMVSALLLTVQCRAKNTAKRRIRAIQIAKRAPIQMETLNIRTNPLHTYPQQNPNGVLRESQRFKQMPQVHTNTTTRPLPQRPPKIVHNSLEEEPGIPWWRRKEINN